MMKKPGAFLEKWGHYFLALLCAGVIVGSSFWVKGESVSSLENAPAVADQAQRLSDARQAENQRLVRPVSGKILRSFSGAAVYDPLLGVWAMHSGVDFQAFPGERVHAMIAGMVEITGDDLLIRQETGDYICYRGLETIAVSEGQQVRAGDMIGFSGGLVPMEGMENHICIRYFRQGTFVDFAGFLPE